MPYTPTKWSMRRFRVRQWAKHQRYVIHKSVDKVGRWVLRIGPDKSMDWLIPQPGGGGLVDGDKLSEHVQNSYIRYHGKSRREHYWDKTLRFFVYRWYEPLFELKRNIRNKFEWWLFFKARDIEWHTHHYISKTKNDHIDGYFEYKVWGIRCGRTFDLCSLSSVKSDSFEWDSKLKKEKKVPGAYVDLNRYGKWGFPTLLVLKNTFPASDIDKVLNKWYDDAVEWKYRHWTWKGERPNIKVMDLKFMEDLCQKCHYDPTSDTQPHADWCEDNDKRTKDISN